MDSNPGAAETKDVIPSPFMKNNLMNESPVTMMDMSEDKSRLGAVGEQLIHGFKG